MTKINRLLTNICSNKLAESRDFYTNLFDFIVDFDSDWFIHLISKDEQLELGIIEQKNDIVPKESQQEPQCMYLTFVVNSADELYETAKEFNYQIIQKPHDTSYGQRRLLIKDPNGLVVDISSPIPNFKFE